MGKEDFLNYISEKKKIYLKDIRKHLKIKGEEETFNLDNIIHELEIEGIILVEDDCFSLLSNHEDLVQGQLKIKKSGDGYVDGILIPNKYVLNALDGDIVLVKKCLVNKDNITEGYIEKIVEQKDGFIIITYDNGVIKPYHSNFKPNINIKKSQLKDICDGSRLKVKISTNMIDDTVNAEVVEVIGHKDDVLIDEKIIAIENGFNVLFSDEVMNEVNNISSNIKEEEITNRKDYREEEIFTIDGINTKDMDDAVSLKKDDEGNYILGVHIADVSHYVKEKSNIYKEAQDRATSVYINNTSIPMLPRKLSNGICSLNPNVDRLTMSVIAKISPSGEILDYDIYPSIINSKMKMNYDDVNRIIEDFEYIKEYKNHINTLKEMDKLSKILEKEKFKRGYLPFKETDVKTKYNEDGEVLDFSLNEQKSAEKIIENFMLVANECIGNYFYNFNLPVMYRIHECPDTEKIVETFEFLEKLGYGFKNIKNFSNPKAIQNILKEISKVEEYPILSNIILRGMKRAKYSPTNIGHFGLALDNYIQFTSPIRRFPDLVAHTNLKKFIDFNITIEEIEKLEKDLEAMAVHSSFKERQADKASREGIKLRMCEYMNKHIGETFEGVVLSINKTYITVKTVNEIKGKIYFSQMKDDFYKTDKDKTYIYGSKTNNKYTIGDKVHISVLNVDMDNHEIEYSLLGKIKEEENNINEEIIRRRKSK